MADIVLENLTKYFGKVRAVEDLNLKIGDGEFLTLLGPSGCGKTTTMRLIAGLEVPTKGNVYIGGTLVNDLPPKDRDVAMVFQSYALYPHMNVKDNLAFPLKMRKTPKDEIEKRVKEVAELLRIEELLDRKPRELSGGQQQRVALGRAIIRRPKVFLMDEPLSNLDAKLRVYMRAELKALQKRLGITTIYVTHDQVEAMSMSERIALMNEGRLQQVGSPDEIYLKPANIFVAGFVGSPPMNFFSCTLIEEDGQAFLDAGEFQYDVTEFKELLEGKGTEFTLGVRPEHITLSKEPVKDGVKATLYVVEPLGSELVYDLKVGEQLVKVRSMVAYPLQLGQEVYMVFDRSKLHIFDKNQNLVV